MLFLGIFYALLYLIWQELGVNTLSNIYIYQVQDDDAFLCHSLQNRSLHHHGDDFQVYRPTLSRSFPPSIASANSLRSRIAA
jgi:hypothetical protein